VDAQTLLDSDASTSDRVIAALSLASELLPVSASDVKDARRVVNAVVDGVGNTAKKAARTTQSALDVARAGGRHAGQLRQFMKQTPDQLRKSIASFEKNIAKHEGWIKDPTSKVANWADLSPQHQQNLLHHWGQDIERARELRSIAEDVLRGL
jgi:hypothetical protein